LIWAIARPRGKALRELRWSIGYKHRTSDMGPTMVIKDAELLTITVLSRVLGGRRSQWHNDFAPERHDRLP
jgi:hypothetical protein